MLVSFAKIILLINTFFLVSCGLTAPRIEQGIYDETKLADFVQAVQINVACQLRKAVLETYYNLSSNENDVEWLKSWSAKITMTLNVDEKTTFSPGINITRLFPSLQTKFGNGEVLTNGRSFDFGIGASVGATASNELQIGWFAIFSDFWGQEKFLTEPCHKNQKASIQGDLLIKTAVFAGAFPASLRNNISDPFVGGGRLDSIQHTVFFYIQAEGNATPTFRFVDVSANTGGPLLSQARDRKDTLLITMGPVLEVSGRKRRPEPSLAVLEAHNSKLNAINFLNAIVTARQGI